MSKEMKLGTEEETEVWFLPSNADGYSPRVLCRFDSVQEARDFQDKEQSRYFGALELVRMVTVRQRVA